MDIFSPLLLDATGANVMFTALPPQVQWFVTLWMFVFGACVGSFMNVVIYRVPAGLSVIHPGSRCPVCRHEIRWYDNIPVLSWLVLRAKCRDCKTPIPARYPSVELFVAAVFLLLTLTELIPGGANLPLSDSGRLPLTANELYATFVIHGLLVCTLICATFVEFDGHTVPPRLLTLSATASFLLLVVWPAARPLTAWSYTGPDTWQIGLLDGITGAAAGVLLGKASWPRPQSLLPHENASGTRWLTGGLCGLTLGWQGAAMVCVVASVVQFGIATVERLLNGRWKIGWTGCLLIALLLVLPVWRGLFEVVWWPLTTRDSTSTPGRFAMLAGAAAVVALICFLARRIQQRSTLES